MMSLSARAAEEKRITSDSHNLSKLLSAAVIVHLQSEARSMQVNERRSFNA